MPGADGRGEPPLYRPFALLAFGATVGLGIPLGLWLLAWLYLGADAIPVEWRLLHAYLQIFGFFGTLIPGVAQHLVPRFTGRAVLPSPIARAVAASLGAALALRIAGTWAASPGALLAAALLGALAFSLFAAWVWRSLDPPPLALLRRHLTVSTGWLAAGCFLEVALRARSVAAGLVVPDLAAMRAVHLMALSGGVLGWITGVLLRAGPMFVPHWRVPRLLAVAVPWILALGVAVGVAGEAGGFGGAAGSALARLGELVALAVPATVAVTGGALRRARGVLPLISRSPEESRIFRLAVGCAAVAAAGLAATTLLALRGAPVHVLTDALRHLVTVGFMTSVVAAMTFRLIPVLERRPLAWPRLRSVAFWALLLALVLRSGEVLVARGWLWLAPLVALSGVLVWVALASVAANLLAAILAAARAPAGRPAA